jgi:hypothetical protein
VDLLAIINSGTSLAPAMATDLGVAFIGTIRGLGRGICKTLLKNKAKIPVGNLGNEPISKIYE